MRKVVFLGLGFLAACGGKTETDAGEDSGTCPPHVCDTGNEETGNTETGETDTDTSDTTVEPIVPTEGNFNGAITDIQDDECGVFGDFDITEAELDFWFNLDASSLSMLVIEEQSDVTGPLSCTMETTDQSFSCLIEESRDSLGDPESGVEAELVMVIRMDGIFTDAESIEGSVVWDFSCEGADCELLQDTPLDFEFPCTSSVGVEASWTAEEPVMPIVPEKGPYTGSFGNITTDECGLAAVGFEDALNATTIEMGLSNRLMVSMSGELEIEPAVNCPLSGPSFGCILAEDEEAHPSLDATIRYELNIGGVWSDSTNLSGEVDYDISCVGTDCQDVPLPFSVPCVTTIEFTASKD